MGMKTKSIVLIWNSEHFNEFQYLIGIALDTYVFGVSGPFSLHLEIMILGLVGLIRAFYLGLSNGKQCRDYDDIL